jgi:hypothetical protein
MEELSVMCGLSGTVHLVEAPSSRARAYELALGWRGSVHERPYHLEHEVASANAEPNIEITR